MLLLYQRPFIINEGPFWYKLIFSVGMYDVVLLAFKKLFNFLKNILFTWLRMPVVSKLVVIMI
jgi:hypothetical protein